MGLLDALTDKQFWQDIGSNATDLAQGASNSQAGMVSGPVDGLAWLLRKAGVPVPSNPIGGSDWMAQQGLTAQPKNHLLGLLGEGVGGVAPMVAAAKAPQIANGLLNMGENLAAPRTMNPQAGSVLVQNKPMPTKEQLSQWASAKRQRELAAAAQAEAERNADKVLAQKFIDSIPSSGMGKSFTPEQVQSIASYRLSGDRIGALSEGKTQSVEAILNELQNRGVQIQHVSRKDGGLSVYAQVNGKTVRISDHELPMTMQRLSDRESGLLGKWDSEIVPVDWKSKGIEDYLKEILGS